MKNLKIIALFFLYLALWTNSLAQANTSENSLDTVDKIIQAYFDRISGPAGRHNWDSFRSLFLPTTQFNAIGLNEKGENEFYPQSLDTFIQHLRDYTIDNGFYQYSLEHSVIKYTNIAHVACIYESRNVPSGKIIDRGLISFHVVQNEGRWWIAGVLWNSETKRNPIPDDILNNN